MRCASAAAQADGLSRTHPGTKPGTKQPPRSEQQPKASWTHSMAILSFSLSVIWWCTSWPLVIWGETDAGRGETPSACFRNAAPLPGVQLDASGLLWGGRRGLWMLEPGARSSLGTADKVRLARRVLRSKAHLPLRVRLEAERLDEGRVLLCAPVAC